MNEHVEKYLDHYCGLKVFPEYGVLLKGAWGAGKTWFIKQYIKNKKLQLSIFLIWVPYAHKIL